MALLILSICAVLLLFNYSDGAANCASLNNPDYGKFDKCNQGNACPAGSKVKLTCNTGFRATSDVTSCDEVKKPADALAAALWDKLNGGKPVANWNPILAPTCVADATHCAPLRVGSLVDFKYSNDKDSCQNGACLQGSQASFSCPTGYLVCGAATITCQKTSAVATEWSGSPPSCIEQGSSCGGGTNALTDAISKFFGGGRK